MDRLGFHIFFRLFAHPEQDVLFIPVLIQCYANDIFEPLREVFFAFAELHPGKRGNLVVSFHGVVEH